MEDLFARLVEAQIEILPVAELERHFVLGRDGFAALVERRGDNFGKAGAPGLLTEQGLAQLIWRGGLAYFVTRNWERPASLEEVQALRRFADDLKNSLG